MKLNSKSILPLTLFISVGFIFGAYADESKSVGKPAELTKKLNQAAKKIRKMNKRAEDRQEPAKDEKANEASNEQTSEPAEKPESKDEENTEPTQTGVFTSPSEGMVNLDFVNAEIAEIAKSISELTNRNFVFDEKVRGKITLVSPRPVSIDEAYRAFVSALEVKNFTVVRSGNLYKIVAIRNMKSQPVNTGSKKPWGPNDEYVTRLIPIEHTSAQDISKSLRGLVSQNGDLTAYGPTNTLIITDTIGNIRRMMKIIKSLDQKGFQESVQMVKLEYAPAGDTAEKIRQIFNLGSNNSKNPKVAAGKNLKADAGAEGGQFISKVIPDDRTNSIIIVANKEGFRRVQEIVQKIDQAFVTQEGTGKVHVHYLQYADALDLSATLNGVTPPNNNSNSNSSSNRNLPFPQASSRRNRNNASNANAQSGGGVDFLGEDVKISADPYTNALIITAAPSEYEALLPVINKLDIRRPQAFVEAMILEINIDKASELGAAGNAGGTLGSSKLFGATNFGSNSSVFLPTNPSNLQGFSAILQGRTFDLPLAGGETLSVPIYGGLFRALQSNGTINVLSTPNILTQDNTEAEIVVGRVVPFITAQGRDVNNQPINQIQREDVAITLRITPQINSSDELTLDIFQENQDLVAGANAETFGPTTSKRSARTTVLVKDGQTVTVGGLIGDKVQNTVSKVPVLGDIPLLGWLFKSKSKNRTKTSLVMFVTPHIIRFPEDLEKVTLRKNQERREFMEENRIKDKPILDEKDLDQNIRIQKALEKKSSPIAPPVDGPTPGFFSRVGEALQEGQSFKGGRDVG